MLTRKNNIRFLFFIFGCALFLFAFLQYKPSHKPPEPKKKNIYGVKDKTVEVDLEKGDKRFCITYEGQEMGIDLKDSEGNHCKLAVNDLSVSYPGEKITEIKNSGKYFLDIKAVGYWQVMIIDSQ